MGESVGLCAGRPGGKSGFWSSGVMGEGVRLRVLHADLKFSNVGTIDGWVVYSLGADLWLIQRRGEIGT